MKHRKNQSYSMFANIAYMVKLAWSGAKSVLFFCAIIALVRVGEAATEMLIAPMILRAIENGASISALFATIAVFGGTLIALRSINGYCKQNTIFGRIEVRTKIVAQNELKMAKTSYCNMLDTRFLSRYEQAVRASSGNSQATEAIWETLTALLANVLGFCVYLALLSNLNPLLAILVIVLTAAGFFAGKQLRRWSNDHKDELAAYEKQMEYICKTELGREFAKDIRIFGMKPWLDDVWKKGLSLYRSFSDHEQRRELIAGAVDVLLAILRNGAAYAFLIGMVLSKQITPAEFLLYFSAVSGFSAWVSGIFDTASLLHRQSMDITKVREFHDYPEPYRFEGGVPLPKPQNGTYELRLENVSYRYPEAEKDTISNMNLTIRPGEKLAIVGLNGAGKTTLIKLLSGFLDPTRGRVLLNGQDVRTFNRRDYYALFAAVFQEFSILPASVRENVTQVVGRSNDARVLDCLEKAGLSQTVSALPHGLDTQITREIYEDGVELSGGEMQRLMLARALYKEAPVLLLDEPTAALDPIAELDLYQKYNAMTHGRTSIYISHRLASTRFCDRILYLKHGKILEEGTHEELIALGGEYASIYAVQSKYYQKEGKQDEEN